MSEQYLPSTINPHRPRSPRGRYLFWPKGSHRQRPEEKSVNPLYSALQDAYSTEEAVSENLSSFRGLNSYTRRWLSGTVATEHLRIALDTMLGRVEQAAEAERQNLETNPDIDHDLCDIVETAHECYRAIAEALEQMLAELEDGERFRQAFSLLQEATEEFYLNHRRMTEWRNKAEPMCPRCSATGEQRCDCELTLLIPDHEFLQEQGASSATLSPQHALAHQAYQDVLTGQKSLEALWEPLEGLENSLQSQKSMASEMLRMEGVSDLGEAILAVLDDGVAGITRMREAHLSLRMSDLNQGWKAVFEAGVNLTSLLADLAVSSAKNFA